MHIIFHLSDLDTHWGDECPIPLFLRDLSTPTATRVVVGNIVPDGLRAGDWLAGISASNSSTLILQVDEAEVLVDRLLAAIGQSRDGVIAGD